MVNLCSFCESLQFCSLLIDKPLPDQTFSSSSPHPWLLLFKNMAMYMSSAGLVCGPAFATGRALAGRAMRLVVVAMEMEML